MHQIGWVSSKLRGTLALALLLSQSPWIDRAWADGNWPNFRGPHGNGAAPATAQPPLRFGLDENLLWKTALPGHGHSSPIVWGDRIYLMTALGPDAAKSSGADQPSERSPSSPADGGARPRGLAGMNNPLPATEYSFCLLCVDRSTGQLLWNKELTRAIPHEGGHRTNSYASASPVTDGQHIWCNFGSQGVWCVDMEGQVVWSRDLGRMVTRNQFGEGASVAVHDDVLVIPWDQERDSFILAVHARTGEDLWRNSREELTSWATPLIVPWGDGVQVITNGTTVRSYDLHSGRVIWQCRGQTTNPIPTPLIWRDMAICMTGHRGFSIQAVALSAQGDVSGTDWVRWARQDSAPYIASPTLVGDTVYLVKGNSGILSSVNVQDGATVIDQVRLPGIDQMYASLVSAAGHVYACGRNGTIIVFPHGPQFEPVHRVSLDEPIDATPAFSGRQLFIRSHQHLYCFASES